MKRVVLLLALFAVPAFAQDAAKGKGELTDAKVIFQKADEATKAVKSVKYEATFKGLGAAESRTPKVEGTVIITGRNNGRPEKFRYEAKVTPPGSSETKEVKVAGDGDNFYVLDMAEKKAYEDIDPAVLGPRTGGPASRLVMGEFAHPTPFNDEVNGKKHEFKGVEDIGGEKCYHVIVEYATEQSQQADWWFSINDFLPRRVDRLFPPQGESTERGGSQTIITKLTADPKIEDGTFKLTVPEGFTKVDDFAP